MNIHQKNWMKSFSTAELARRIGDVTHAATEAPVAITHHSKPRFVMMSVEYYEHLRKAELGLGEYGIDLPEVPGLIGRLTHKTSERSP